MQGRKEEEGSTRHELRGRKKKRRPKRKFMYVKKEAIREVDAGQGGGRGGDQRGSLWM